MDHDRIAAEDTVNRYLNDTLSRDEAQAFEQHYLDCQQCLDQMADTQALRAGLSELADAGYLQQGAGRARSWFSTPAWAAAATVLLAISLITNAVLIGTKPDRLAGPGGAQVFDLVTVRTDLGEPVNVVDPAAMTETIVLLVDSGRPDSAGRYRAAIVPEDRPADRFDLGPLAAGPDGRVAVVVPAAMLTAGIYRVDVSEHQSAAVLNSARFVWKP